VKAKLSWSIFWALVAVFVVIASVFLIPALRELLMGFLFIKIPTEYPPACWRDESGSPIGEAKVFA